MYADQSKEITTVIEILCRMDPGFVFETDSQPNRHTYNIPPARQTNIPLYLSIRFIETGNQYLQK